MDQTASALRERTNLKDEAAGHVRSLIFTGVLRPRQKIDQDVIAAALGISRQPVREAMISLEREGLIQMVARRGAFVAALTADDIMDHFLIFGLVAGLSARRSVERLTDADVEHLAGLTEAMERTVDAEEQRDLNHQFHRTINLAGASRSLVSMLSLIGNTIPEGLLSGATEWWDQAARDHWQIVAALRNRDGEQAAKAVEEHLRHSGEAAVRELEAIAFWGSDGQDGARSSAVGTMRTSAPTGGHLA